MTEEEWLTAIDPGRCNGFAKFGSNPHGSGCCGRAVVVVVLVISAPLMKKLAG